MLGWKEIRVLWWLRPLFCFILIFQQLYCNHPPKAYNSMAFTMFRVVYPSLKVWSPMRFWFAFPWWLLMLCLLAVPHHFLWFASIFSHSVCCLLIYLMMRRKKIWDQKFLILMIFNLPTFSFAASVFGIIAKKPQPNPKHEDVHLCCLLSFRFSSYF